MHAVTNKMVRIMPIPPGGCFPVANTRRLSLLSLYKTRDFLSPRLSLLSLQACRPCVLSGRLGCFGYRDLFSLLSLGSTRRVGPAVGRLFSLMAGSWVI